MIMRRVFCGLAALGGLIALTGTPAVAAEGDGYPTRPVRFIAPFPAGGSVDLVSRVIANSLSQRLGQQFVVENKSGASGNIGADLVAKAPPDGYTIGLVTISSHGINPSLYTQLPFDPVRDFTPITLLCTLPNVMVITPKLAEIKTVGQFIAYAKARPGQLNFGSPGNGTSIHLSGELFKIMAGVDMVHIPYRGSALAQPELTAGGIHVMFDNLPSIIGPIEGGSFPALAVTTKQRWPGLPNVPTLDEAGVPGFDVSSWFAIVAPANLPRPLRDKLNAATVASLQTDEIKQSFYKLGAAPVGSTPEMLAEHIKTELARWAVVVKASGAKVD
jgi:tripartite-type tricarboxylate transporter receptor subunit TctC